MSPPTGAESGKRRRRGEIGGVCCRRAGYGAGRQAGASRAPARRHDDRTRLQQPWRAGRQAGGRAELAGRFCSKFVPLGLPLIDRVRAPLACATSAVPETPTGAAGFIPPSLTALL